MDRIENRSHQEVEGDADELQRKLAEQVELQNLTVEDKHEVKAVAAGLNLGYSEEAGDVVTDKMTKAGVLLDGIIDDQSRAHAEQAAESINAEGLAEQASHDAEEDSSNLEQAAGALVSDGVKATVNDAVSQTEKERAWADELHDRVEGDRTESEEETRRHVDEVHGTTVTTRRSDG